MNPYDPTDPNEVRRGQLWWEELLKLWALEDEYWCERSTRPNPFLEPVRKP